MKPGLYKNDRLLLRLDGPFLPLGERQLVNVEPTDALADDLLPVVNELVYDLKILIPLLVSSLN